MITAAVPERVVQYGYQQETDESRSGEEGKPSASRWALVTKDTFRRGERPEPDARDKEEVTYAIELALAFPVVYDGHKASALQEVALRR